MLRNKAERAWCVMVGPNDAGVRLPTLREEVQARPEFERRRGEAEALISKAETLERRAQELREQAKHRKADLPTSRAKAAALAPWVRFSRMVRFCMC